jgi:hypothetical protein
MRLARPRLSVVLIVAFSCCPFISRGQGTAPTAWRLDFGNGPLKGGYTQVLPQSNYSADRGFGWTSGGEKVSSRDRVGPDELLRDFVMGTEPATLRLDMAPGTYTMRAIVADPQHGDHGLKLKVSGGKEDLPPMQPKSGEASSLTTQVEVTADAGHLEIELSSTAKNWILNGLTVDKGTTETKLQSEKIAVADPNSTGPAVKDTWEDTSKWSDPMIAYVESFRKNQQNSKNFKPTGLSRKDYLVLTAGDVDFFKQHQDANGAIIDPYKKVEWQYSTPCFALAAAELVVHANRKDLLEPAAKAMDWACLTLSEKRAATAHEDFFPPQLAHALPLLKTLVAKERYDKWVKLLGGFNPWYVYRSSPGRGNWNVVALSGEFLLYKLGIRKDPSFIENSLAGQGNVFSSHLGLYLEGPMAYDHFPRLWAADAMSNGYNLRHAEDLHNVLSRGAVTSLFMQSPAGELPLGGRSAHHQWNEAEQCVTYEIFAEEAKKNGDEAMAGAFKRAAHLGLKSIMRWRRPSGEMQIVKNWVDPAKRHGFEGYSAHSQYNLLPMAMLSIAWEHAEATEDVAEKPAPCDVGGFVLQTDGFLHKTFANAGGMYIELDTASDLHYDANGLMRIHKSGMNPQIGPSDTLLEHSWPQMPSGETTTSAIGPEWTGTDGAQKRLGMFGGQAKLQVSVSEVEQSPEREHLLVKYDGQLSGPKTISEEYTVTPDQVKIVSSVEGADGMTAFTWPVLAFDGRTTAAIDVKEHTVTVSLDGTSTQTFTAAKASRVSVGETLFPNRNGWARLARAEFDSGGPMEVIVRPEVKR